MKCQKCKNDNPEGSKFCMICGAPLDIQQTQEKKEVVKRERTFGEKVFVFITHTALCLAALSFLFILFSKFSYKESVNQRERDGEIDVIVMITPPIIDMLFAGSYAVERAYDVSPSEIDSKVAYLKPLAINKYQDMMNEGLLYSFIILVIVLIIDRYVTKMCTPN